MALREQFTWNDFLRTTPELKKLTGEQRPKRTSAEWSKKFDDARKTALKKHLTKQVDKLERQATKATTVRDELVAKQKTASGAKKAVVAKRLQTRVGQKDHAIAMITNQIKSTKDLQKTL